MRRLEVGLFELDGHAVVDTAEKYVFVAANGDSLELRRRGDDLQKTLELCVLFE